ncbi:beta-alanine transporter [Anopheles darlingi]|uniref:beta-alanine transporter n=1 Tax=Anopheles darlingi TaxID=43151 RepID=UPI002100305B|nr:beta-alanine transporter [Anopheles darlingi]XP_049530125.1 beta-alanine transporter [Anopheles darlingi]XP_049530126.1 beta-alanine transporter [Anopheles darlingi]XP_049530127.1 beta-alanine transporter [Anopheles darlingi]XP_049530128.1 beta-alanine transporter [Anopheles darlingi]XP_049530130.1 beta-alanine transporter [Anopheles darlingi]
MANSDATFDEILAEAGDDGRFQRHYNWIFNFCAISFASMSYMSIILALNKPPHNCHVPGMERYNITDMEQWKNLTLPRETDNRGLPGFSKCQMYNVTEEHLQRHYSDWNFQESDVIACAYGYDYDRTYYDRTPITEYDWICDKGFRETNIFIYNRLGELVGTVVFGHLGDTIGRRPVLIISILVITAGRLVSMFTAAYYVVFCIAAVVGSLTAHSIFQAPLIIAMEISKSERRGHISMMQCFGWTTGMCILPMVFWATKDWFWALMVATLPIVIFTCISRYQIESPRWMATRGDYRGALQQLKRIANINGIRELPYDEHMLEKRLADHRTDTVYGIASLFDGWRMTKNTLLVVLCWTVGSVLYFTLVLLSSRMDGNPFLNFMYQSLIEVPAALIGQRVCDRFGRRTTNATAFLLASITCLLVVLIVRDPSYETLTTALATLVKFCISITFFAVNLQSIEIYPTCLRQTGMSVGTIAATLFGIVGPYLVHLGTEYDVRYPFIVMGLSAVVGMMAALFLPETLHQALPNTIEEARLFGKDQRFWSLPKPPKAGKQHAEQQQRPTSTGEEAEESVRLNVPEQADVKVE